MMHHSVESDQIRSKIAVLATSLLAISDDFKIIYGKFERNEVTFILNFDQFEVIFFGSEVGSLSFIFQFSPFTVVEIIYHTGRFDTNINRYTFWSDLEIAQVEITRETKAG